MGAWGLGLFQSDHDLDIISDLDREAGIKDDSLYCPEKPDALRKYLDAGALEKVFAHYMAKIGKKSSMWKMASPEYYLVILDACAMEVGCIITPEFRTFLNIKYRSIGLMRDALTQMSDALASYANGTPHHFDSPGIHEVMRSGGPAEGDRIFPGGSLINVPSPEMGMAMARMMREVANEMDEKKAGGEYDFAAGKCGNCGASKAKNGGGLLMCCGRCKSKRYCGQACQKVHWKKHKLICKVPTAER